MHESYVQTEIILYPRRVKYSIALEIEVIYNEMEYKFTWNGIIFLFFIYQDCFQYSKKIVRNIIGLLILLFFYYIGILFRLPAWNILFKGFYRW